MAGKFCEDRDPLEVGKDSALAKRADLDSDRDSVGESKLMQTKRRGSGAKRRFAVTLCALIVMGFFALVMTGSLIAWGAWSSIYEWKDGVKYLKEGDAAYVIDCNENEVNVVIASTVGGKQVKGICADAFSNCSKLTSVVIPNGVQDIGERAFEGCYNLSSIYLPEGLKTIGGEAFANSGLRAITIPDSITSIGVNSFWGCDLLLDCYYTGTSEQWESFWTDYYIYAGLHLQTVYFYSETSPSEDGDWWHYVNGNPVAW